MASAPGSLISSAAELYRAARGRAPSRHPPFSCTGLTRRQVLARGFPSSLVRAASASRRVRTRTAQLPVERPARHLPPPCRVCRGCDPNPPFCLGSFEPYFDRRGAVDLVFPLAPCSNPLEVAVEEDGSTDAAPAEDGRAPPISVALLLPILPRVASFRPVKLPCSPHATADTSDEQSAPLSRASLISHFDSPPGHSLLRSPPDTSGKSSPRCHVFVAQCCRHASIATNLGHILLTRELSLGGTPHEGLGSALQPGNLHPGPNIGATEAVYLLSEASVSFDPPSPPSPPPASYHSAPLPQKAWVWAFRPAPASAPASAPRGQAWVRGRACPLSLRSLEALSPVLRICYSCWIFTSPVPHAPMGSEGPDNCNPLTQVRQLFSAVEDRMLGWLTENHAASAFFMAALIALLTLFFRRFLGLLARGFAAAAAADRRAPPPPPTHHRYKIHDTQHHAGSRVRAHVSWNRIRTQPTTSLLQIDKYLLSSGPFPSPPQTSGATQQTSFDQLKRNRIQ